MEWRCVLNAVLAEVVVAVVLAAAALPLAMEELSPAEVLVADVLVEETLADVAPAETSVLVEVDVLLAALIAVVDALPGMVPVLAAVSSPSKLSKVEVVST